LKENKIITLGNGLLTIFDYEQGKIIKTIQEIYDDKIVCCSESLSENKIATGSSRCHISIWSLNTYENLYTF